MTSAPMQSICRWKDTANPEVSIRRKYQHSISDGTGRCDVLIDDVGRGREGMRAVHSAPARIIYVFLLPPKCEASLIPDRLCTLAGDTIG